MGRGGGGGEAGSGLGLLFSIRFFWRVLGGGNEEERGGVAASAAEDEDEDEDGGELVLLFLLLRLRLVLRRLLFRLNEGEGSRQGGACAERVPLFVWLTRREVGERGGEGEGGEVLVDALLIVIEREEEGGGIRFGILLGIVMVGMLWLWWWR